MQDANTDADESREICWECGRRAECSDHFIGCAGAVARLCDDCRDAAVRRNQPDADGRRSC